MKECERKSLQINNLNFTINATINSINTTVMSASQLNQLTQNATNNTITTLPKCDIEKFITEVSTSFPALQYKGVPTGVSKCWWCEQLLSVAFNNTHRPFAAFCVLSWRDFPFLFGSFFKIPTLVYNCAQKSLSSWNYLSMGLEDVTLRFRYLLKVVAQKVSILDKNKSPIFKNPQPIALFSHFPFFPDFSPKSI